MQFRQDNVRKGTMRIQLGTTAKAQGSIGLGLDTRSRYQEQILANVQYSSVYSFNQPSNSTSMAEHELQELQRLVVEGPKTMEAPQAVEERQMPYVFLPMVEEPTPIRQPEQQPAAPVSYYNFKPITEGLCNRPAQVGRTQRGTIEFVIQEDGRRLVPEYNKCGILTGVDLGDGTKLTQEASDGSWCMTSPNNKQALPIKSVAFDRNGSLSISSIA